MKFLIVGYGSIGRRHYQNLVKLGFEDVIFLRTGKSTLDDAGSDTVHSVSDIEAAMDWQPDAAIIANPTAKHLDAALPLARAGIDLLIEKPISHNLEGANSLLEVIRTSQSKVMVGYQFRFHPSLEFIQNALKEGLVGRPLSARAYWGEYLPDWHPWEDFRRSYSARQDLGGGVILTLSHPLDYLRWLFGSLESVTTEVASKGCLGLDVEDLAELIVKFTSGVVGSVLLNYCQKPPVHTLTILGTEGSLQWNNQDGTVFYSSPENDLLKPVFTLEQFKRNDMFIAELKHFLQVIRGEVHSACDLEDGIGTLKLCLGALKSAELGERVNLSD